MTKRDAASSCAPRQRRRLLIRLDANHTVGLGHAVRSGALMALLGDDTEVAVVGDALDVLAGFFPAARLRHLDEGLQAIISQEAPDAILVDLPRHDAALWTALHQSGRPIIAIDDEGGTVPADLVVNGTVLPRYHHYTGLPEGALVLTGAAYTLIRPEFGRTPWRGQGRATTAILIGSGERARDWAFTLAGAGVDRSTWGAITMVVGAAFPDRPRLQRICREAGITLRWSLNAQAMADLLADAGVALMTGGMVVYEALAVGVPVVVFPQVPNLIPEARWFAEHGIVRDLGYDGGMEMERVAREVGRLHHDGDAARSMAKLARSTVDGNGLARAADAIRAVLRMDETTEASGQ